MSRPDNPSTTQNNDPVHGPWLLKASGVWGTGRRSRIEVNDVRVVNLGTPPLEDEEALLSATFLASIVEVFAASSDGLDITLGMQTISHKNGQAQVVRHGD